MFRNFLSPLLLLMGLCITSLFGIDNRIGCSYCPGSGFLIGGYGAFHVFSFHIKDSFFEEDEDTPSGFLEYDAYQRASGGGGIIGYGIPFCERFNVAFKVAAAGVTSDARHSYSIDSTDKNYTYKMRVKYIVDISLEPGALIGNYLLVYFKFGASNVGSTLTRQILAIEPPDLVIIKDKQQYHNWGYVFGSGANVAITRCISVFAEYDWHSYPFNNSTKQLDGNGPPPFSFDYRVTSLYSYGIKLGLMAQF